MSHIQSFFSFVQGPTLYLAIGSKADEAVPLEVLLFQGMLFPKVFKRLVLLLLL